MFVQNSIISNHMDIVASAYGSEAEAVLFVLLKAVEKANR